MSNVGEAVAANLNRVHQRIAEAATGAGRGLGDISLVAVSKMQPIERVEAVLDAGQRIFGENRVQEAIARWTPLRPRYPDLRLHLIGPLQSNKVRDAVGFFDVIESLDRERLARRLAATMEETGRRVPCLIQVNTGEEPQKAGVAPAELADFVGFCRTEIGLEITGLMCIPPVDENPAPHFALLADAARRHGLAHVSMGMSEDFETAVRFGATHVRVGSAIFGDREMA